MKTKIHLADVATKLVECRDTVKQAADRMSQGSEWDLLQSAMVTLESAAGSLVDSNHELDREIDQIRAESAKAVSDALAHASAVKIDDNDVSAAGEGAAGGEVH